MTIQQFESRSIAVVVPAFNEAATIGEVVDRALSQCPNVIVVDDGSTDGTADILSESKASVIRHAKNRRKAAAIWSGMQAAMDSGASAVITLDGDGQHRPEDIPMLLRTAEQNPDSIIIGSRLHQRAEIPTARYRANRIANFWISWAAGYPIEDSQSGFRLYPTSLLRRVNLETGADRGFVFESEILIEAAAQGFESIAVEIPAIYSDQLRASHFRPVADITGITLMVGGRLLRRGLFFPGLYRSYLRPQLKRAAPPGLDRDGLLTLVVSLLAAIPTLGLGFLWLFFRVHQAAKTAPTDVEDADAVIVLGHELIDGRISEVYRQRLDRALQMYRDHPRMDVHIAGGRPSDGITEAEAGYRYLLDRGVEAGSLFCEDLSSNTVENIKQIHPFITHYSSVAVVSSRYHLMRIATIAAGMHMKLEVCGAESSYRFSEVFPRSLVEGFYLHWYWAGRIFSRLTNNDRMLQKIGQKN